MSEPPTALTEGQSFTAVTTGTLRGERWFRERRFVASRDQDVERLFVPIEAGRVAQDRVYVEGQMPVSGQAASVPELVVSGSIKVVAA